MGTERHGWRRVEAFSLALGGMQDLLTKVMPGSLVWGVVAGGGQACGSGEKAGQLERWATFLGILRSLAAARLPWSFAEPRLGKHNKRYNSGSVQLQCVLTPQESRNERLLVP
jgi:hypothetical protein